MPTQPESWIKLGDILTALSVILAFSAYVYSRKKDQQLLMRSQADGFRTAAALTLAKLDRCEALFMSYFYQMQPLITAADEMLVKSGDEVATRDQFWKELNTARIQLLEQFREEQIEISYAPLVSYHEKIRKTVHDALAIDEKAFWTMLNDCQIAILQMSERKKISATLGNELRAICARYQEKLGADLAGALGTTRGLLLEIMASSDRVVLTTYATPSK